jgi:branched-chain amino acid transport system ATP-binding protein
MLITSTPKLQGKSGKKAITLMALLEVHHLFKNFGGVTAVNDCTFQVEKGSITSLIGPNGAGKTTAFNLISGVIQPTSGKVFFDGHEITNWKPNRITRLGISRTFQITRGLSEMSVLENVVVHSLVHGFRDFFRNAVATEERDRAYSLLDFVGIAHLADLKAKNLSYGQKKLMELAAVMMSDPKLVLLDEPAGGVNPSLLETIIDKIFELNKQGITFLIVEHNMDMVMKVCNPVICMAYGNVLAVGPPEEIQQNVEVLEAYLGVN